MDIGGGSEEDIGNRWTTSIEHSPQPVTTRSRLVSTSFFAHFKRLSPHTMSEVPPEEKLGDLQNLFRNYNRQMEVCIHYISVKTVSKCTI